MARYTRSTRRSILFSRTVRSLAVTSVTGRPARLRTLAYTIRSTDWPETERGIALRATSTISCRSETGDMSIPIRGSLAAVCRASVADVADGFNLEPHGMRRGRKSAALLPFADRNAALLSNGSRRHSNTFGRCRCWKLHDTRDFVEMAVVFLSNELHHGF